MTFSEEELRLALDLKKRGLEWTPAVGHFVLDQHGLIERDSPFQPHVYFILDLKHFLRRADSIDELQKRLCWLPTWEQARTVLQSWGLSDESVAEHLRAKRAIEKQTERLELYRLIEHALPRE